MYLHQKEDWTNFHWDSNKLLSLLGRVRYLQGQLLGQGGKITKTSPDTALRDIQDLIIKGILRKEEQGGRSTNYELNSN